MTDRTSETKEQFEARYAAACKGRYIFGKDIIAMPCTCEDGGGPTHWAAVLNDDEAIKEHADHEAVLAYLRERETEGATTCQSSETTALPAQSAGSRLER